MVPTPFPFEEEEKESKGRKEDNMSNPPPPPGSKRPKPAAAAGEQPQPLLPGLPDHLAQLCLAPLPPYLLFSVSRSWRRLLYSPSFPAFLSLYALLQFQPESDNTSANAIGFASFDPISGKWTPLPAPPPHPPLLLRHPSFLSRPLPIQSVAAGGHLILLAATTHRLLPALRRPLAFHPLSRRWLPDTPPFPSPRRWCAAGSAAGAAYLFSGVGSGYSSDAARSAQRWDPRSPRWDPLPPLRDGRFSREAVEAVAASGKICMVNQKGRAAKEGAVYDIRSDRWEEMPAGMVAGWTGPAAADEGGGGPIFVVDEESGSLRAYEWEEDTWRTVVESSERLKGATQMAAGGGRVCVTCEGGAAVVVVDVAGDMRKRRRRAMWVVRPPSGTRVIAVHVLPRVSREDES